MTVAGWAGTHQGRASRTLLVSLWFSLASWPLEAPPGRLGRETRHCSQQRGWLSRKQLFVGSLQLGGSTQPCLSSPGGLATKGYLYKWVLAPASQGQPLPRENVVTRLQENSVTHPGKITLSMGLFSAASSPMGSKVPVKSSAFPHLRHPDCFTLGLSSPQGLHSSLGDTAGQRARDGFAAGVLPMLCCARAKPGAGALSGGLAIGTAEPSTKTSPALLFPSPARH